MQRPPHLDLFPHPRHSPRPASLPTPPTEAPTASAVLNPHFTKPLTAPMSPTTRFGSYDRRVSRSSFAPSASSDDAKRFVLDNNAHPTKYMHFWDQLNDKHGLPRPNHSEHQVKQDPTGTLKSTFLPFLPSQTLLTRNRLAWEYELPRFLWPPIKENAKMLDPTLKIRWGRENGYVQITNIGKALFANLKMVVCSIADQLSDCSPNF